MISFRTVILRDVLCDFKLMYISLCLVIFSSRNLWSCAILYYPVPNEINIYNIAMFHQFVVLCLILSISFSSRINLLGYIHYAD